MKRLLINYCLIFIGSMGINNDDYNVILNGLVGSSFSPKRLKTPPPGNEVATGSTPTAVPLSMECVGLMVMQARAR